jgi:uncharacterized RDD family membrane protein YckC/DNA-binding transcriptional ArsR family regulator
LRGERARSTLAVDEDSVTKILSVLSHPIRRDILNLLSEKGECTFTDLLNALEIDTGKLSFHLRTLQAFTEQTKAGKYRLNRTGESAVRVIRDVESWAEVADVQRKAEQLLLASFRRRAYSFLIDLALMLAITSLFALPEIFIPLQNVDLTTLAFIPILMLWGYSTLLEGFNGQTIGKRIIGLKVVRTDGKKLSYDHAAIRNFGKAFLLPFDLLVGLQHEKVFLRYFDKFAGTTVIDLRLTKR